MEPKTFENKRLSYFAQCGVEMRARPLRDRAGRSIYAMESRPDGPPIIVMHGGGGGACSVEWAPLLPLLSPTRRWICVDRGACGLSEPVDYRETNVRHVAVQYVEDVLRGFGLRRAAFLANSMGGYFAIAFAHAHPEQVDRLVLIGAPAGITRWLPWPLRLLGLQGINRLLFARMAHPTPALFRDTVFRPLLVVRPEAVPDELLRIVCDASRLPGTERGWRTLLESVATLRGFRKKLMLRDELCRLQVPTRFIWGDRDVFDRPSTGADLAERMADARIEVIENAGHLPWLDEPQRCASAIEAAMSARATACSGSAGVA